jgi:hypothetical protein
VSFLIVSVIEMTFSCVLFGVMVCLSAVTVIALFANSCECNVLDPSVRKKAKKTILNKFVCNGINAIFVKIWFNY